MRKLSIVLAAALCGVQSQGALTIDHPSRGHRYYYGENHLIPSQEWNGKSFVVEADLVPPEKDFADGSWCGISVDDTKLKERFIFGPVNTSRKENTPVLSLGCIEYRHKKSGGINDLKKKFPWPRSEKKITVRVAWDGARLTAARRLADGTYEAFCEITPTEGFAPTKIGLTAENYVGRGRITAFKCTAFRVLSGDGPAKSDPLDGTAPQVWTVRQGERAAADWEYPHPFVCAWQVPMEDPFAFDNGSDAVLNIGLKTWRYGGREIRLAWKCRDYADKEIAQGREAQTLPAEGKTSVVRIRVPASALAKNGCYRMTVSPQIGEETFKELTAQFSVIPARQIVPGSLDPQSPYTMNYLAGAGAWRSWNLTARLGAKAIRQPYWSEGEWKENKALDAQAARRHGILINSSPLSVFSYDDPAKNDAESKRLAHLFMKLREKYGDVMYCSEVYNEPESIAKGNTEMTAYCSMMGKIKRELERCGSSLKLMCTGAVHCNLDFLNRVVLTGGRDSVDIVTTHGYRSPCRPEFGWADDIQAIKDLFGTDKPIICNEDSYFAYVPGQVRATVDDSGLAINIPSHTLNELDELTHGVYTQRKFLNQLMAGYTGVNQFNDIDNHNIVFLPHYHRPGVVTYAALTWLMPHPKFESRLTDETDSLWGLKWTTDGEEVLTFWAMDGFHRVTVSGENVQVFDTYANTLGKGGEATFVAGVAPVFVKGRNVKILSRQTTDERPAVVLREENPLAESPFDATILGHATDLTGGAVINVTVRNNSGKDASFSVKPVFVGKDAAAWGFKPAVAVEALKAGETKVFAFTPYSKDPSKPFNPSDPGPNYTAIWWTEGYQIGAEVASSDTQKIFYNTRQMGLRGIPRLESAQIDAEDSEWGAVAPFKQLGSRRRNVGHGNYGWYTRESYCPTFKLAWSKEGLLFYAEVLDARHDVSQKGLNAWRTDSIQLGLSADWKNPDHVAWPLLTFSLANKEVWLQRDMPGRKAGPVKEIVYATKRMEGDYEKPAVTIYEALIPWSVIGVEPMAGHTIGYSILFNQSIGYWRNGWEGYFQPLGGHIVDPTCFGDLTLCDK